MEKRVVFQFPCPVNGKVNARENCKCFHLAMIVPIPLSRKREGQYAQNESSKKFKEVPIPLSRKREGQFCLVLFKRSDCLFQFPCPVNGKVNGEGMIPPEKVLCVPIPLSRKREGQ